MVSVAVSVWADPCAVSMVTGGGASSMFMFMFICLCSAENCGTLTAMCDGHF